MGTDLMVQVEMSGFDSHRGGFNFSHTLGLQGTQGKASCSHKSIDGTLQIVEKSVILQGFEVPTE